MQIVSQVSSTVRCLSMSFCHAAVFISLRMHCYFAVDFSSTAIQLMSSRYAESMPEMSWRVMDAKALDLETGSFDLAVEVGLLDAVAVNGIQILLFFRCLKKA